MENDDQTGPVPFSRTLRSLEADGDRRRPIVLLLVVLLLVVWLAWFFLGRVSITARSAEATVVAAGRPHSLEAGVDGRVAAVYGTLGSDVTVGDVVVELDDTRARALWDEAHQREMALEDEHATLLEEIESQKQALKQLRSERAAEIQEAASHTVEAEAKARQVEAEAARAEKLAATGLLAQAELERQLQAAKGERAAAQAASAARDGLELGEHREVSERAARLLRLQGEVERLSGELESSRHRTRLLEHDVELHRIRAPVPGRLGNLLPLRPGAEVERGDSVGAVIPHGGVAVIAYFDPAQAVGRIQPGQRAKVRLHGFPWSQYGTLPASVVRVASEASDGRIRAELAAHQGTSSAIPLQHGLPGLVEVEVETVSPFTLVVRAAGRRIPVSG